LSPQREDGLNKENMPKSYGGKQRGIRPTLIREGRGYLRSFNCKLNPGDMQHFIFAETDEGVFWMNPVERESEGMTKSWKGNF
jgi:hypothetical protein